MRNHANFSFVNCTPFVLTIRDTGPWDKHPTITNDVEWVVRKVSCMLGTRKLLYYDSEGALDELVVKDGVFAGFAPGPRES